MVLQQPARSVPVPALESGDRLTRAEFERRYAATPQKFKAELIKGVIYVASLACGCLQAPEFYSVVSDDDLGRSNKTVVM